MVNSLQNRSYLNRRHRLSHQQIDRFLHENRSKEFLHEKLKQLEIIKSFLQITDILKQKGIYFINLKGPLLSYRIYHDPTVRILHDIDILIDKKQIERVMNILFENGYNLSEGAFWPHKKNQQELFINNIHHLSFFNKGNNLCVEVHWVLMHELSISKGKLEEFISVNTEEIEFAGRKFNVFTKEFELLYLLIHGSRHKWHRLKWLFDIKDYPLAEVNYKTFNTLVNLLNAERIINQANYLLKKFFNTQLPFTYNARLPKYIVSYSMRIINSEISKKRSNYDIINNFRYQWLIFPGIYYKYKMLLQIPFSPRDIPLFDSSYKTMYYMYRPFSFIKRRILHA
ncbi:MAG: nucleotidyltransferase family protein [Bacteroidetes bacterium]|nr:nucleotidyltransferase family protein [Bacteroidota bacterium]